MDQEFTPPKRVNNVVRPKTIAPPSRPGKPVSKDNKGDELFGFFEGELPAIDETGGSIVRKGQPKAKQEDASEQSHVEEKPQGKAFYEEEDLVEEAEDISVEEEVYTPQVEEPKAKAPPVEDEYSRVNNIKNQQRELKLPATMTPRPPAPQTQGYNTRKELETTATRSQPKPQVTSEKARSLFNKAKGERKASKSLDPRLTANIIRIAVMAGILLFAALGIYGVVNPNATPSGAELNTMINQATGKSNFPTDKADGFILAFSEAYFTKTEDMSNTDYSDQLKMFAPESLINTIKVNYGDSNQEVAEGPYVSGVRYVDDYMAAYTVSVKLSTSDNWIYVQIPIFYNIESKSFTIAGVPGLVPEPPLSNLPTGYNKSWSNDEAVAREVKADFDNFFTAWGASNQEELIRLLSPEASLEAKTGLSGNVTFISTSDIEVQRITDDPEYTKQRLAQVQVKWIDFNEASYVSTYEMLIEFDGTRWNVRDIRAGIPE